MLQRTNRLTRTRDFEILSKEGRFVGSRLVGLKFWKIDPERYPKRGYDRDQLKIGFVVGKKVHKSAVQRNRVKRRMREAVRLMLKDGRLSSGYMMMLMAVPATVDATYQEIEKDIHYVFKKAGLDKRP